MKLRSLLILFFWVCLPGAGWAEPGEPTQTPVPAQLVQPAEPVPVPVPVPVQSAVPAQPVPSVGTVIPMRGERGVLTDFQPNSAVWLSDDRILVGDWRFNNLQIFDTEGRRFRLFDAPSFNQAPVQYVGLASLGDDEYLALGSFYQEKNHPRYRNQRSKLHRFHLAAEDLDLADFETDLAPTEALRRTGMWGATPARQLEFAGLALDRASDTAWFGLAKPASEQGNLMLLRCSMKGLLDQDSDLKFTEVDTGFELPEDGPCGLPTYLADLATLDDGSLLFLLTADDIEGKRFCSNSIWHWSPGGGPATMIMENLAMQNRARGMAVRSLGDGQYKIALVCDNDTVATGIPAGFFLVDEPVSIPAVNP